MRVYSHQLSKLFTLACLIVILLLAGFLRSYNIENLPAGIYPDEAVNAADALHSLEVNHFKLFYENNQGREGLFINLQALALKTFGISIFALKLWSMIFGTLTVLSIYLLAKEIWQKRSIALISAYLTAVSYWAINFSRIGFRAIMVPFLLSFSFYFFFRGLRTKSLWSFAFSGGIFALGLHTYIAFRLAPIIFVFFLIGLVLSYKNFFAIYAKHALVFVLAAFVIASPMFLDFYHKPTHFFGRSNAVSIFSPNINHGNFWGTLSQTIGLSLIKYNFVGDQNWRHNYPPYPVLDPLTGIAFLAGFIYLLFRTILLFIHRIKHEARNKELAINMLFLSWFFTMLMPEFLTDEGLPHALRSIGTIPVVILIATMPFLWIEERWKQEQPGMKMLLLSAFFFLLVGMGIFNSVKYFVFYSNNPKQHDAFNENYKNMAMYLLTLPQGEKKYVFTQSGGILPENHLPIAAQPIAFLTYKKDIRLSYIMPEQNSDIPLSEADFSTLENPSVIVLMDINDDFIKAIHRQFPKATDEIIDLRPGFGSQFRTIHIQ
jgi:4-amino-4-deoxy-L-arabinose transferase-like glycosyltransferase